jgi:23S rRNA (cytosine1962-C5)-methyltransferase
MNKAKQGRNAQSLRLHVTAAAEKILRSGHPWLFADSILQQNREGIIGEMAVIYDRNDKFLGLGLFDPCSPIRVRLLHTGRAHKVDSAWWAERLESALKRREGLFDAKTTGYRCIHGENDRWPGLVLDRYGEILALKLYTAAWLPKLDQLIPLFVERFAPAAIVLRLSRNIREVSNRQFQKKDGDILYGDTLGETAIFLESGLRFEANVIHGQKTGFFLDQRNNRQQVEILAPGREVLNAFSFSGGFSVYAARGGALSVTDLDISSHALASAKRNFDLNRSDTRIRACRHQVLQGDAFKWLNENSRHVFDMIVLDPPSLAKRETERTGALRGYYALAFSAFKHLRPGGILVACSCSAHVTSEQFFGTVRQAASDFAKGFLELQTTHHPPDHPATFKEAAYLKAIFLALKS